ncbi:hypothetical protein, partial [Pseudomonas sp.]|uniref:hypothetical protein n=1 Tax=Pseudomonas sp. TaxID=306 RepID=UPI003CC5E3B8
NNTSATRPASQAWRETPREALTGSSSIGDSCQGQEYKAGDGDKRQQLDESGTHRSNSVYCWERAHYQRTVIKFMSLVTFATAAIIAG